MKIIDVEQNTDEWLEARKGIIKGSNVYNVLAANTATKDQIVAILDENKIEYPLTTPRVGNEPKPKGTKDELALLLTTEMEAELMRRADKKVEFYQLIADRIALDTTYEYDENDEIVHNGRTMMDRGHDLEDEAAVIFAERTGKELTVAGICVRDDNDKIGNSPDRLIKNGKKFTEALEVKCIKTAKHLKALIEQSIPDEYFSQAVQYFVVNDDLEILYFAFFDPRIPYECRFHWIEIKRSDPKVSKRIAQYLVYENVLLAEADKWVEKLAF